MKIIINENMSAEKGWLIIRYIRIISEEARKEVRNTDLGISALLNLT